MTDDEHSELFELEHEALIAQEAGVTLSAFMQRHPGLFLDPTASRENSA